MNKYIQIIIALAMLVSAFGCNVQSGYRIHGPNPQMYSYDYSEYPRNKRSHECEGRNFNPDCRDSGRARQKRHGHHDRHGSHHHH